MAADDPKEGGGARSSKHATTVPNGTRIVGGTYEVERLLKAGGMGEVYRGRNVFNNLPVAIKIVLGSQASDETHTKLFEREALVLSKLAHEAIVRYHVYTVDPIIGRPCLVMEYVDGPSLMERMTQGPMPMEDVRTVMRRVASGLAVAHKLGVIHRDLSPDNVILEDGLVEHAKLIDFGIAKGGTVSAGTMLEGRVAGKYNYMAPEQLGLANGVVDARADIYALGLVVVGMFRGSALNMGENPFEAITRRQAVPDLSSVPPEMHEMLARMLAPNPEGRPDSMATLIKMLDQPGFMPPSPPPVAPGSDSTVLGGRMPVHHQTTDIPPPYVTPPPSAMPLMDSTVISPRGRQPATVTDGDDSERTVVRPRRPMTAEATATDRPLDTGLGRVEAAPAKAAPATPAKKPAAEASPKKGKGLPLALVGVVVAAAIGGGTFFMLQGGQTPATDPNAVTQDSGTTTTPTTTASNTSSTPTTTPAQTPAKPPVVQDFSAQLAWLAAAAKGNCLHFELGAHGAGAEPEWTALTAAPDGVAALSAKFTETFKTAPKFGVVQVAKDQCAALEFATIRGTPTTAGPAIALEDADGTLSKGATLRGSISGTAGRTTALFLISSAGAVARLDTYVTSDGKTDAKFDVPLTLAPGSKASDQLLLSVTTSSPVADFATVADGYSADTVMPRLALWLQQSNQFAEITLKSFRLEP